MSQLPNLDDVIVKLEEHVEGRGIINKETKLYCILPNGKIQRWISERRYEHIRWFNTGYKNGFYAYLNFDNDDPESLRLAKKAYKRVEKALDLLEKDLEALDRSDGADGSFFDDIRIKEACLKLNIIMGVTKEEALRSVGWVETDFDEELITHYKKYYSELEILLSEKIRESE